MFKALRVHTRLMRFLVLLFAAGLAAPMAVPAQQHSDQREAFEARRLGRVLPVREIERRVVPTMRGSEYIGFDFNAGPAVYTLKFLRDGTMIWVDVDGRTGQVLGRTDR